VCFPPLSNWVAKDIAHGLLRHALYLYAAAVHTCDPRQVRRIGAAGVAAKHEVARRKRLEVGQLKRARVSASVIAGAS
jgi:hypothetical protein